MVLMTLCPLLFLPAVSNIWLCGTPYMWDHVSLAFIGLDFLEYRFFFSKAENKVQLFGDPGMTSLFSGLQSCPHLMPSDNYTEDTTRWPCSLLPFAAPKPEPHLGFFALTFLVP